jgi:hypothetical protein
MHDLHEPTFDAPSSWCDRRCQRCPLSASCRPGKRGGAVLRDVAEDFGVIYRWLGGELKRSGVADLRAGPVLATGAERLTLVYVAAAKELGEAAGAAGVPDELLEVLGESLLLAAKVAQIGGVLARERQGPWRREAVPNLLLVEQLDARIDRAVRDLATRIGDRAPVTRFLEARAALWRALGPWLELVPDVARAELAGSVRSRRAPSPFCVS